VINEQIFGLGNISILDMDTTERGILYRTGYDDILSDIVYEHLYPHNFELVLVDTIEPAKYNIIDPRERSETIEVRLNCSIYFDYNESAQGRILYKTNLYPADLIKVYLNGTELPEDNYTIDSESAVVYNYREHHSNKNGTLHFSFIYDYIINVEDWEISQFPFQDLYMTKISQSLSVRYNFGFSLSSYAINISTQIIELADDLNLTYQFSIQDSEKLRSFSYSIGDLAQTVNNHKNSKNWFNGTCPANQIEIALNFTADFTVEFKDVCYDFWAIDRLVWMNNVRERIYFLSITDGPSGLNIEDIQFNELNIYYGQYLSVKTNFERSASVINLNLTGGGGLDKTPGLKTTAPYFIKNEVLAVIVRYFTNDSLTVVITDQVLNPVEGVVVKFYYFNHSYGTYISLELSQSIPLQITDFSGRVTLPYVPKGLYRVELYTAANQFVANGTADTEIALNYINTPIPHVPTTIIIFTLLYSIIFLIGAWIYIKNKKID